jgi:hypothetical protein
MRKNESMRTTKWLYGLPVLALTWQNLAGGNCVTCRDFNTPGSGYTTSPTGDCSNPPLKDCFVVANVHASLTPGMLVEERDGALQVAYVFPESPAAHAGVAPGDRIDSINGSRPGASCPSSGWSKGTSKTTQLVVSRGARTMTWLHRQGEATPAPVRC